MAYGSGNSFDPNTKVLYFDLKEKDLPAPQFKVQTKEGTEYVDLPTATRISGTLAGIRVRERQIKNKKERSVSVTLKDTGPTGPEVYFVRIPFTHLGRGIINRFANLQGFDGIELSLYNGKPNKEGKVFGKAAVRHNGELVYEKHEREKLPAIPKVEINGEMVGNPAEINAFFIKEVEALEARIKSRAPQAETTPASESDGGEPEGASTGTGDKESDPPF